MNRILLTEELARKWFKNLVVFLLPLLGVYLTSVAMTLQQETHFVSLRDFIPNSIVVGAIFLYVANAITDYGKKLRSI